MIGETDHDARFACHRRDPVRIAPAVLERQDRGAISEHRRRRRNRRRRVIALDEIDDEIDRADILWLR
jgi:hypothetical protein